MGRVSWLLLWLLAPAPEPADEPEDERAAYGPRARAELTLVGNLGYWAVTTVHSKRGGAAANYTHYFTPIVDDGTSRWLQPFLQRASYASIGGRAGGFSTSASWAEGTPAGFDVGAGVAGASYLGRRLKVFGAAAVSNDTELPAPPTPGASARSIGFVSANLAVGAAARLATLELGLAGRWVPSWPEGRAARLDWYTVAIDARWVVRSAFDLFLEVEKLPTGAALTGRLGYYFSRDYGVVGTAFGGHGRYFTGDPRDYSRIGGALAYLQWLTRTLAWTVAYDLTTTTGGNLGGTVLAEHSGIVTLRWRLD